MTNDLLLLTGERLQIGSLELPLWSVRLLIGTTLIWLLAVALVACLQRSSAALRHRIWVLSVLAALVLPLLVLMLPEARLGPVVAAVDSLQPLPINESPADFHRHHERPRDLAADPESPVAMGDSVDVKPASLEIHSAAAATAIVPHKPASATGISPAWLWLLVAPMIWRLAQLAFTMHAARRLVATASAVQDRNAQQQLDVIGERLGWRGAVRLLESDQIQVPLSIGWRRPCILVPIDWRDWSNDTLRSVLAHELSHVIRRDVAWQLAARLACALYWFHPLAWLAAWRMRVERETACDDSVLRAGELPTAYARVLLDLAARLSARATIPSMAVAMATRPGLEQRVRAVLSTSRSRTPVSRALHYTLAAATLAIALAVSSLSPAARQPIDPQSATGSDAAKQAQPATNQAPAAKTDLYGDPLPAGADVRMGTIRLRDPGTFDRSIEFVDNSTIISLGDDFVQTWNVSSGKLLGQWQTSPSRCSTLCLSPDRTLAASLGVHYTGVENTSKLTIQIWKLPTGELQSTIRWNHDVGEVKAIAFSPNGKTIATVSTFGMLHVWDVASGIELSHPTFDGHSISRLFISPDDNLLVFVGNGVWLWRRNEEAEPVRVVESNRSPTVALSPSGDILAFVVDAQHPREIELLDTRSRQVIREISVPTDKLFAVNNMAFTPDGKTLVSVNETMGDYSIDPQRVSVWDIETGRLRHKINTGTMFPRYLAVSPDGRLVAAADRSAAPLGVWDLATGKPTTPEMPSHEKSITSIRFSADAGTLITASEDGKVRTWDTATGRPQLCLTRENWVTDVDLSPDGKLIASIGNVEADALRIWEAASGKEVRRLAGNGQHGSLAVVKFLPDSKRLVSWGADGCLRMWDVATSDTIREHVITPSSAGIAGLSQMVFVNEFSPDGSRLYLDHKGIIRIFDAETGKELPPLSHDGQELVSVAASLDGRSLLYCAIAKPTEKQMPDGGVQQVIEPDAVRLRRIDTGETTWSFLTEGRDSVGNTGASRWVIGEVAFSGDGKFMAAITGRTQFDLRVWDVATHALVHTIEKVPYRATRIALSHNGSQVACGFVDGSALVWKLPTPEKK